MDRIGPGDERSRLRHPRPMSGDSRESRLLGAGCYLDSDRTGSSVGVGIATMDAPTRPRHPVALAGERPRPIGREAPPRRPLPEVLHRLAGRDGHRDDVRGRLGERDVQEGRQAAADLISAPVHSRSSGRRWAGSRPNFRTYIDRSARAPRCPGKSRKNTPSKRSARLSSGQAPPAAHCRSRSTDSPAVTATGTMFCAASTSGTSSRAASRQHDLISAPGPVAVLRATLAGRGRTSGGTSARSLAARAARQVEEEHAVEPLGSRELRRQLRDVVRRGDHEDVRLVVVQPRQQRAEHAGAETPRVACAARRRRGPSRPRRS